MNLLQTKKTELDFWNKTSFQVEGNPFKSISMTAWPTIFNRIAEAQIFIEKLNTFESFFTLSKNIVDLGGGQCWASCMVKLQYPNAHVTGTDIAQAAIDAIPLWERIFQVKIDCELSRKSYETLLPNGSVYLVFAFSSAHHFGRYRQTIFEISRILKPGGVALFLHEPSCHPFWYRLAKWRINRRSYRVQEDVLLTGKLKRFAMEFGMTLEVIPAPTLTNRSAASSIYYFILGKLPFLQKYMPCSIDLVFSKY